MNIPQQIAKQLRDVYSGGNWTAVNLKQSLEGVNWQQATTKVHSFNTIAMLVYHMNYYVDTVLTVIQGGPLDAHDKYSFELTPIQAQDDWEKILNKCWADAEKLAGLIEKFPESKLAETFADEKYGSWYRNLTGIIEHNHYHLGQITLIKKLL